MLHVLDKKKGLGPTLINKPALCTYYTLYICVMYQYQNQKYLEIHAAYAEKSLWNPQNQS